MKPRSKLIWGVILVAVGIILLGETTGMFDVEDLFSTLFPVGLIVLGAWLILRRKASSTENYAPPPPPPPAYCADAVYRQAEQPGPSDSDEEQGSSHFSKNYEQTRASEAPNTSEAGKLKYSKTIGDMFVDCTGVNLQNIEVSAGIGDLEIKLNGGVLGDGLNRLIISNFIGDIRIYAGADMPVFTHCSNFVGDIEVMGKRASGFGNSIDAQTAGYQESSKKLYVACNSFIGDIKIYGL